MSPELTAALAAAFFAGLLGSGHCFGMCGGIAAGLGAVSVGRDSAWRAALTFNAGRLLSYALLGGVLAVILGAGAQALGMPDWGRGLRLLSSALVAVIGLQLLTGWRGLAFLERAGAGLWARVAPLAGKAAARPGPGGRLLLGMCWGFLPCGLVYTALLTAAASGRPLSGAAIMLAFGLGTLPALMGLTLAAPAIGSVLRDRAFRRIVGAGLLLLALLSAVLAWPWGGGHVH